MTQKELNYIEDFYNHELLIKEVLLNSLEDIENEEFEKLINCQLNEHEKIMKETLKLMEGDC